MEALYSQRDIIQAAQNSEQCTYSDGTLNSYSKQGWERVRMAHRMASMNMKHQQEWRNDLNGIDWVELNDAPEM